MSDAIVWVPGALLAVTGLVLAVAVAVVRLRRRVATLERALAVRAQQVEAPSPAGADVVNTKATSATRGSDDETFVITSVVPAGGPSAEAGPAGGRHAAADHRIEGSLFADLVLREAVVKGVSFVHGVRRALAPETRNRIGFEMRQEVKRSRKQRRTDLRAAKRHLADQQRAAEDAA